MQKYVRLRGSSFGRVVRPIWTRKIRKILVLLSRRLFTVQMGWTERVCAVLGLGVNEQRSAAVNLKTQTVPCLSIPLIDLVWSSN